MKVGSYSNTAMTILITYSKVSNYYYRVGHSELKRHVKACYSLITDFVFTKIHMGIVQNLMDKNIPKHFDPASNWPH